MAPQHGNRSQRTSNHTAHPPGGTLRHKSSINSTQSSHHSHHTATRREGDRARETQRKRIRHERRTEAVVGRRPSPTIPLSRPSRGIARMASDHCHELQVQVEVSGEQDMPPRTRNGRGLQARIARGGDFSDDGGHVQQAMQGHDQRDRAVCNGTDYIDDELDEDGEIDNEYDLFATDTPHNLHASTPRTIFQPVNTEQYSSHHLPFNLNLHPPRSVQPATRREPIRLLNSWTPHEPDIDKPSTDTTAKSPGKHVPAKTKRPVNPYKGKDVVKRLVQNKRLRALLSDRPMPRPRKAADRMDLKCAGRKIIR